MAKLIKPKDLGALVKRRTRSYSASAAITTIVVHAVIILFAGSIVAVRYVQKQNAQLIARTEAKPKMERKKLQMPVKAEQLQKKALTSKLVSKKVSIGNPSFVLPDTGKIGSLKTQKLSLPGANAGRALTNLSRAPGIGPSRIDFFGVRAEGEKVVFIIDASAPMLDDRTGGPATYEYIKQELARIASELKPAMLFNLIFFDQQRVCMFRTNLVAATRENVAGVTDWLQAVNRDPAQVGLSSEQNNYNAPVLYETAVGTDARGWVLALQAALEQQPDAAMILSSGWGHHYLSPEKAARMLDYALWELMAGSVISKAKPLESDRKLRDDLLKEAATTLLQNDKRSASKSVPAGFVRDIAQYVEYSKNQVLDHLDTICRAGYSAKGQPLPKIHFVCLTETANKVVAGGTVRYLWALTGRYTGKLEFLRRDPLVFGSTESSVEQPVAGAASSRDEPPPVFFNAPAAGSRVAFILDASGSMLSDATGGAFSYGFIKERILAAASGVRTGAQFNVILHDGKKLALFQPKMVGATAENIAALKAWLQPVNSDPANPGIPDSLISNINLKNLPTVIGDDSSGWLRALQAAMEQQSDAVFMTGTGWGEQVVTREKGRKLLDFSIWNLWGSGTSSTTDEEVPDEETMDEEGNVTTTSSTTVSTTTTGAAGNKSLTAVISMKNDLKQRDILLKEALKVIEAEDRLRKAQGGAQPFVRDIVSYLRYTAPQVGDHLKGVVKSEYSSGTVLNPVINYICLSPADGTGTAGEDRNLNKLVTDFGGELIIFRGGSSRAEIQDLNRSLETMKWQVPGATP